MKSLKDFKIGETIYVHKYRWMHTELRRQMVRRVRIGLVKELGRSKDEIIYQFISKGLSNKEVDVLHAHLMAEKVFKMKTRIDMACEAWDDWLIYRYSPKCRYFTTIHEEMKSILGKLDDENLEGFFHFIEKYKYITDEKLERLTAMALALWCVWPELGVDE